MRPVLPVLLAALARRETPQELSHDRYIIAVKQMLDLNNTISVADPSFGLLTNTQAAPGMGTVTDTNCLQLTIADCAFTNAKASNNLTGMVASLIYRALERNTPRVGLASEQCTMYTPRNKELSTFHQHQDPASPGAQENNKAVSLELARQIAHIGGEPTDALYSGTFRPGEISSTDFRGNACDTADCIFTENLFVRDASEAEIYDYVGKCVETVTSVVGGGGSMPTGGSTIFDQTNSVSQTGTSVSQTGAGTSTSARTISTTATTTPGRTTAPQNPTTSRPQTTTVPPTTTPTSTPAFAGNQNYMTFSGAYLGVTAPQVTQDASGIYHTDTDTTNFGTLILALARSCDIQKNDCADTANRQRQPVGPCDIQLTQCKAETNSG